VKVTGANVAEALQGPLGWIVVGGVTLAVLYFGLDYVIGKIEAPFKALGAAVGTSIDNTVAPVSTLGGSYKGSDGSQTAPDGTDMLSLLALGGLGA
jgi:hypothetical protein